MIELLAKGSVEREKKGHREEVTVEEVFVPLGAISCVGHLGVETHDCREQLGESENDKTGDEGSIDFRSAGG